jgi:aspartate/methionine/tyrosine aminotransferase
VAFYHIHDEAYEYFTYGERAPLLTRIRSPGALTIRSRSSRSPKSYGFASWRIGYQVVPDHLFGAINKMQDTVLICSAVWSHNMRR